jgi:uncharacterized protein YndB with AHSA1/START domain
MPEIKHLLHINATADKIYQAITKEEGLKNWWTDQTTATAKEEAVIEFRFGDRYHDKMKVVNLESNKRVEWLCIHGESEWIDTTFVFDLESNGNQTILRFTHGNWRESTDFFASCNYHWGYYLRSLKLLLETGKGTPFQESKES